MRGWTRLVFASRTDRAPTNGVWTLRFVATPRRSDFGRVSFSPTPRLSLPAAVISWSLAGGVVLLAGIASAMPFVVNQYTTGDQSRPGVAVTTSSDFVVIWESFGQDGDDLGVFGRFYSSGGAALGTEFQVNQTYVDSQSSPAVAPSGDGFVVVWEEYDLLDLEDRLVARRYDGAAFPLGDEFRVDSGVAAYHVKPSVSADSGGTFVVAWDDYDDVFAQLVDTSGQLVGTEFRVNADPNGYQALASVAMLTGGGFVVAWTDGSYYGGSDGDGYGVFARRFGATGVPIGLEFQVNAIGTGDQMSPAVVALPNGGFSVVWETYDGVAGVGAANGSRFDSAGVMVGSEFRVSDDAAYYPSSVAADVASDGEMLVVWSDLREGLDLGIVGRRFDSLGMPREDPLALDPSSGIDQTSPAVAYLPDGRFVAAWEGEFADGDEAGVVALIGGGGSPSPIPTASVTATVTGSAVPTSSSTPSSTPTPTESATRSATPAETPSPTPPPPNTPTATESATASAPPTLTPALTPTKTGTRSSTPTESPTSSTTATRTSTSSPTDSATPSVTATSTPTSTSTPRSTSTSTSTWTETVTPIVVPSDTQTATPTGTRSPTSSTPATSTSTPTRTPSSTRTATASATFTSTRTASHTRTATAHVTSTATGTGTWTRKATRTVSSTRTQTPTVTPSPSVSPSQPSTPSPVGTATPTGTERDTPTSTPASSPTLQSTATPSSVPTALGCSGDCDGDSSVSISELIAAVNVALGLQASDRCFAADVNGDGEVRINELIQGVNRALSGCGT